MDSDERAVFEYLQTFGEDWIHAKEVCRKAATTKQRYHEDNSWALPVLQRLREHDLIEDDLHSRFRVKPQSRSERKEEMKKKLEEAGLPTDAKKAESLTDDVEGYEQD